MSKSTCVASDLASALIIRIAFKKGGLLNYQLHYDSGPVIEDYYYQRYNNLYIYIYTSCIFMFHSLYFIICFVRSSISLTISAVLLLLLLSRCNGPLDLLVAPVLACHRPNVGKATDLTIVFPEKVPLVRTQHGVQAALFRLEGRQIL